MTRLPHHGDELCISDGGMETTLVFDQGLDLPDFAAFPLLETAAGRTALRAYYTPYLELSERLGARVVLDTPTWRASLDWGARLGFDAERLARVNRDAVEFVAELAGEHDGAETVVNGVIGPRGDGYLVDELMTADEAKAYHFLQARAFADAGAEMISAVTMTSTDEAIGVVRAANRVGVPVVVSFTVETDGRLPSGTELSTAVGDTDRVTGDSAAYFMVNCAHPTHFAPALRSDGSWLERIKGIRANASALSHAELDEATEVDRGDIEGLAEHYAGVRDALPGLRVVGGCCGTDHEHVRRIAERLGIGASR